MVMKALPAVFLASSALIVSMAGYCQAGAKKDAKTDGNKAAETQTTVTQSSVMISRGGSAEGFGSHLEPILKTVSANEEQRKSITAIVEEFKVRIVPLRKKHDELRDQFLKSLTSGQPGETVLATQSEFIRAQTDLNAQYLALRLKIAQVLTAEQNEKYTAYRKKQGWKSANK
jgi:Spy/CpxP family protein refolding chaperone